MKKLFLRLIALFAAFSFNTGCSNGYADGEYEGKMEEVTQWATYTAEVVVTVKDGKIEKVTLKDASTLHSPVANWGEGSKAWTEHYNELLDSYVGLDAAKVAASEKAPVDALAGATLSSDRLYLAVKDALLG